MIVDRHFVSSLHRSHTYQMSCRFSLEHKDAYDSNYSSLG